MYFSKYFLTDKDECLTDEHNCDSADACVNTIGSFTCSCAEDEIQDGDTCVGIKLLFLNLSDSLCESQRKTGRGAKHNVVVVKIKWQQFVFVIFHRGSLCDVPKPYLFAQCWD